MKNLIIIIVFLVIVLTGLFLYGISYIENYSIETVREKNTMLEADFYEKLDNSFKKNNRLMIAEEYGNASYTPMDIDAVNLIDKRDPDNHYYWSTVEECFPYGRYQHLVSTMFKCLKPGNFNGIDEIYAINKQPWQIVMVNRTEKDKICYVVFKPVAIAYLKGDFYLREFRPSLDECSESALEYITKEDKDFKSCFDPNCGPIIKDVLSLCNRYYYLQNQQSDDKYTGTSFNFESFQAEDSSEKNVYGHRISWIYNNHYRLYYDVYPLATFTVGFNKYNYDIDKNAIYNKWIKISSIIYVLLLLALFFWLAYLIKKKSKIKTLLQIKSYSSLYEELLEKCNPENFMNPYNQDMVQKSNVLYQRILTSHPDDNNLLLSIRNEAHAKLNIMFDTNKLYTFILEKANPKQYINPYNPDKLSIANEIYSAAIQNKDNVDLLEGLVERIKREL